MVILIALFTFVLLPALVGSGLLPLLLERKIRILTLSEGFVLAFAVGLSVWSWLVLLGYSLQLPLRLLGALYTLMGLISMWLFILTTHKFRLRLQDSLFSSYERTIWIVATLCGAVYFFVGAYQDPSADSFRHLAFIRRLVEWNTLSSEIYVLSPNEPHDLLNGAYAYNSIHAWYAWIASVFHLDPARLWFHAPGMLLFLALFAIFSLSRIVGQRALVGLLGLEIYMLVWALAGSFFRAIGHPESLISRVVYPAFMVVSLLTVAKGQRSLTKLKKFLVVYALLLAPLFFEHSQWWMFSLITLGLWSIYALIQRNLMIAERIGILLVLILLFSLPFIATRAPFYMPIAKEMKEVLRYRYEQSLYSLGPLYGFQPGFVFSPWTVFFLLGALIALRRGRLPSRWAAGLIMAVPVILLTPISGVIASVATTTIAARLKSLLFLWGPSVLAFALQSWRAHLVALWRRMPRLFQLFSLASMGGWLAYQIFIWPLIKLISLHNIALRQRLLLDLAQWLNLTPEQARTLLQTFSLWFPFLVLIFVFVGVLVVLSIARKTRRRLNLLKVRVMWRKPRFGWYMSLVGITILLLLAPGSLLSPWQWRYSDKVYARLYGPTLTQTLDSHALKALLSQIPHRALVVTDHPNWLIAFRDVYVANSVQGELRRGKEVNQRLQSVFSYESPVSKVVSVLSSLTPPPQYLLLSPLTSNLAWMKYDNYPSIFHKISEVYTLNTDYFNNTFVLYALDLDAPLQPISHSSQTSLLCEKTRLYPHYRSTPPPEGWNPNGDELYDGRWNDTDSALLWVPLRPTWFYVEFGPFQGTIWIDSIVVRSYRFTSAYHLSKLALFVSNDGQKFEPVAYHVFNPDQEDPVLKARLEAKRYARYLRLAIYSYGATTLGEVEIYGCIGQR